MILTIDSSVWVASFIPTESSFEKAHELIAQIKQGQQEVVLPLTVLIEVAAAIFRQTKDEELANKAIDLILTLPNLDLVELDHQSAMEIVKTIKDIGLKGMDTIVVYTAKLFGATLVTLDQEMKTRSADQIVVLDF
jgi:predicted nucleic acid-binding protein